MATFTEPTTVAEAIDQIAKGLVRSSSGEEGSVEYLSLKDLIEADRYLNTPSPVKPHFGLRMTKLIPPGTG